MYHKVEYILQHVFTYWRPAPVTLYVVALRTTYLRLSLTHMDNWINQKTNKNPKTKKAKQKKKGVLPSAYTKWQCFNRLEQISSHDRQFAHRDKTQSKAEAKGNARWEGIWS